MTIGGVNKPQVTAPKQLHLGQISLQSRSQEAQVIAPKQLHLGQISLQSGNFYTSSSDLLIWDLAIRFFQGIFLFLMPPLRSCYWNPQRTKNFFASSFASGAPQILAQKGHLNLIWSCSFAFVLLTLPKSQGSGVSFLIYKVIFNFFALFAL